ncbi:MAG: PQQ-dependent sugar dehydrogenase, partial [Planctomycetaceae bacterium]
MRRLTQIAVVWGCILARGGELAGVSADPPDERPYGIESRVPWTTSRLTGSPEPPPPYRTERVWPALTFAEPVEMTVMPGTDRLAVLERLGKVFLFSDDPASAEQELLFDLSVLPEFRQAFGIVFHPDFAENRYVYVCYTRTEGDPHGTLVSRFTVSRSAPYMIDPTSETVIVTWFSGGHNGGCLMFGPDGCLYISAGDGSSPIPPDTKDTGQDISDLLASVLRIDVDHPQGGRPYSIPPDNPFLDIPNARPEVWAYGFRNPWKMSFDALTRELWVGDVGWEMWEMIDRVERGGNYGWSLWEGPQSVRSEATPGPTPVLPPVISHSHTESRSITGGLVYRGSKLPNLAGAYVYGDYVTGKIWALRTANGKLASVDELVDTSFQIIAFAADRHGELYVLGYDGSIHQLAANSNVAANHEFPQRLSETGLFQSVPDLVPAAGVIPYSINAEPWSDGAQAERMLGIPGATKLGVHAENRVWYGDIEGAWAYPTDTVFAKTLSLPFLDDETDGVVWRPVETQLLHRDGDTWRGYAYAWDEAGTDAALVPAEGMSRTYLVADPEQPGNVRQQTWRIASRTECIVCHTTRAGSIHGFNAAQIDCEHDYGAVTDNQMRTLVHIGLIDPPEAPSAAFPPLWDASADLNERGRAYLHVNCGHCHFPGGGGTASFDLRSNSPLAEMRLIGHRPTQGAFGIPSAQVVAAGDPYHSVLLYRMAKLGRGRMPHAGSDVVDRDGVRLIRDWIQQLPPPDGAAARPQEAAEVDALAELSQEHGAAEAALDRLLASPAGALRLVLAIDDDVLSIPARTQAVERGAAHPQPEIRDLFERFLPEAQRTRRLGTVVRVAELLSTPGDAARGEQLFFHTEGVQCKSCHKVGPTGGDVGPELREIARKNTRAELLESILEPSRKIDPKYVSYLVETAQGRVFTGLLASKSDVEVVLRDAQNKLVTIPNENIELFAPQQKS